MLANLQTLDIESLRTLKERGLRVGRSGQVEQMSFSHRNSANLGRPFRPGRASMVDVEGNLFL
jgi:hypothetical protein